MRTKIILFTLICAVTFFGCAFIQSDNLNQAARASDLERCREQVEAGADVNGPGMHGMMPLMSACESGSLEVAVYLLGKNADINSHNDSGSALMWAVHSKNIELIRYLLDQGADVLWKNSLDEDVLDHAKEVADPIIIALISRAKNEAQSGRQGVLTPAPHTTGHTDP